MLGTENGRIPGKQAGEIRPLLANRRKKEEHGTLSSFPGRLDGWKEIHPVARLKAGVQIITGIRGKKAENPRFPVFQDFHLHRNTADGHIPDLTFRKIVGVHENPFGWKDRVMYH